MVSLPPVFSSTIAAPAHPVQARNTAVVGFFDDAVAAPQPSAVRADSASAGRIAVRSFFNGAQNWLVGLPSSPIVNVLEGSLLMVRRTLFNEAPQVLPSTQTTSQYDATIGGRIGAVDLEGEELTYAVVGDPRFGDIEVDTNGVYTYNPGPDYAGQDSFTVRISPPQRSLNVLNLAADGSREVTIQLGEQSVHDTPDIAVNLVNASGHITITKNWLNQFTGTVTITAPPDTPVMWMDTTGRHGSVSVDTVASDYWPAFKAKAAENGATVDLTIAYTDADGTDNALLLNAVEITYAGNDQYVFTGRVAPDPAINATEVDVWDIVGKKYKPMYGNFRKTYKIDNAPDSKFTTVDIDFTGADVYADTVTPLSYRQAGLYAQDSEANPQAIAPPAFAPVVTGNSLAAPTAGRAPVTASISIGNGFAVGREGGSVELWIDGEEKPLRDPERYGEGSFTAVSVLMEYNRPLKDDQGNTIESSFIGYISGTTLTVTGLGVGSNVVVGSEISGDGVAPGTTITRFIDQVLTCVSNSCNKDTGQGVVGTGTGGRDGYTGTYEVSISQNVGSQAVLETVGIVFTQKDVPAVAPGFVAGTNSGAVRLWSGADGWTELRAPLSSGIFGVTSIIKYGEGFVVGLYNGDVWKWSGPGTNPDPASWKKNWTWLNGNNGDPLRAEVTALMPYKGNPQVCAGGCDGFLVGLVDGSVYQFNEAANGAGKPGWYVLRGKEAGGGAVKGFVLSKSDPFELPTFAVALRDRVEQWEWKGFGLKYQWTTLIDARDWASTITAVSQFGKNFVVGLADSAVELWNNDTNAWQELHNPGWKYGVNTIVPFDSASVGKGVVVGLDNGSVQAWSGKIVNNSGQNQWTELHNSGWVSGVATIVPVKGTATTKNGDVVSGDGVAVGLKNGALEEWSGLVSGKTAQADWTQLTAGGSTVTNWASEALSRKGAFACSDWKCSNPGALQDAVAFGEKLAAAGTLTWGPGGVGGPTDPIFGVNPELWAASTTSGTYVPFAIYKKISPESLNYTYPNVPPVRFNGVIEIYQGSECGNAGANQKCSVLIVKPADKTAEIKKGMALESDETLPVGMQQIRPGTTIASDAKPELVGKLGVLTDIDCYGPECSSYYVLSGLPQEVNGYTGLKLPGEETLTTKMKASTAPSFKVGLDLNPLVYGYVYMPDGFFPKFKPGAWSVAALLAAQAGPSMGVTFGSGGIVDGPTKSLASYTYSTPGPMGFDSVQISTGLKASASLTVNGLDTPVNDVTPTPGPPNTTSASVSAYVVPGTLVTFNTKAAPGDFQLGANYYFDLDASAFKDVSGASLTATLTPYANLIYGVTIPQNVRLVGGWSLFTLGLGIQNPISATLCIDAKSQCPGKDANGKGGLASFYGVINDGASSKAGAGNVLTVTQGALYSTTEIAIGQLVKGPAVAPGTTITKDLGLNGQGLRQYELSGSAQNTASAKLSSYVAGEYVSVALNSEALLTFHAGALEGITSALSYDMKVPLYQASLVVPLSRVSPA